MFSSPRLIALIPWIFVFLWSTGFVGAKYALPYAEPFTLLAIRMSITVAVFAVLIPVFKSSRLTPLQALHQMVVGVFVHVGYLGSVFAAIKLGLPAGVIAIIVGLQPLVTAIFAHVWFDERLKASQWLGLFTGFTGVAIVLTSDQEAGDFTANHVALLYSFFAVFCISIGTLYQKRFGQGVDLITGSFYQYLITAIVLIMISFAFESRQVDWTLQFVLAIAWLVFGLSVVAILLLMYLIRIGESAKVASYFYMVPVFVVIETWLLFDERLSMLAILGMLVTVFGIYLVLKSGKPAPRLPKV